jgi:nucleotide-binding universal stress UspA family protein
MTKLLIGVDGSERSEDAVAFGRAVALAAGAPVILAMAYPASPLAVRHGAMTDHPRGKDAEDALARLAGALQGVDDVELRPLASLSVAQRLHETAEEEDVGLIVVGSSHTGRFGRVLPGSTAERLLHGAPCPVAVVPEGYRRRGRPEQLAVGCAYRPTVDGDAALGAAEELALALSASLRVMHVVEPMPQVYDAGETSLDLREINASIRADAERTVTARVASLSPRLQPLATLYDGRPADVLTSLSETVDLLVIGSRGYGPLTAVLLGGVSGQVIRSAACPVVVVPRGAHSAVGSLFASWRATERS